MRLIRTAGLLSVIVILTFALVLSACIQIEVESQFESDGSGRHSIASSFDRSLLDDEFLGEELGSELDFDEIEREAEAAGLETERIDDADRVGVRVIMEVDDNEDLGDVLDQLFNAMDSEGTPVSGFQGGFTQSGGGIGGTTYHFELTVDGDQLFADEQDELDGDLEDELDMDFGADMMRQFINLTYTVNMPGELTDHNGTELGGGRVRWDIPFEGSATFIAESEEGGGVSMALILGIGVGVIAVILIIIGGIVLMRGSKTPTEPEPAPRGPGAVPTHPVTGQPDPVTDVDTPANPEDDQSRPRE